MNTKPDEENAPVTVSSLRKRYPWLKPSAAFKRALAKRLDIDQKSAAIICHEMLRLMAETIVDGDHVCFPNLGVFKVVYRRYTGRPIHNLQGPKVTYMYPEVHFYPAKPLKRALSAKFPTKWYFTESESSKGE